MKQITFDPKKFNIKKYIQRGSGGLSHGVGDRDGDGQVCIEALICICLKLDSIHQDDPGCVSATVRRFKISLNDSSWSSPRARWEGLKKLGVAQLGSLGVVDDVEFSTLLSKKVIQKLIPKLFREVFPTSDACQAAADVCEKEGSESAAKSAANAAKSAAESAESAANAANAAESAAWSAAESAAWSAESAAWSAESAASAAWSAESAESAAKRDEYLRFAADLALEVLVELKSPGVKLLGKIK